MFKMSLGSQNDRQNDVNKDERICIVQFVLKQVVTFVILECD